MFDRNSRPPRPLRTLIAALLPRGFREEVVGDLEEEWAEIRDGRTAIGRAWWYVARGLSIALRLWLEAARTQRYGNVLADDVRSSVLALRRSPAYTLLAMGTLTIGLAVSTTAFTVADALFVRPVPFEEADRMVLVWRSDALGNPTLPRLDDVRRWRTLDDLFEQVRPLVVGETVLIDGGEAIGVWMAQVEPEFLTDLLHVRPAHGSLLPAGSGGPEPVILSHELWKRRYEGRKGILGQVVRLGGVRRTVVGIMPAGVAPPGWPAGTADVWAPLTEDEERVQVVALLRPGVDPRGLDERLLEAIAADAPSGGNGLGVHALTAAEFMRDAVREEALLMTAATGLLLLITVTSVTMLTVHRALTRGHETALRATLGAPPGRLVRKDLIEGLVLALAAVSVGVPAAIALGDVVAGSLPADLRELVPIRFSGRAVACACLMAIVTGLLLGLSSSLTVREARGDRARTPYLSGRIVGRPGGHARVRWALVAAEVAVSFVLLLGGTRVLASFREHRSRTPGFDDHGLAALTITLPAWAYEDEASRGRAFGSMSDAVAAVPGVSAALVAAGMPPGMEMVEGRINSRTVFLRGGRVQPGFFELVGQELLFGRSFRPGDETRPDRTVVVSEALAREILRSTGNASVRDALGRSLVIASEERTVIGVVEDIRIAGLAMPAEQLSAYLPMFVWGRRLAVVFRARAGVEPAQLLSPVTSAVLSIEPEVLVDASTATGRLRQSIATEKLVSIGLSAFGLLALLLAALGLYGVVSRTVHERSQELGVRLSLGAGQTRIRWMVLRSSLIPAVLGLALGAATALIGPLVGFPDAGPDWWMFPGLAAFLLTALFPAVWLPAKKATEINVAACVRMD